MRREDSDARKELVLDVKSADVDRAQALLLLQKDGGLSSDVIEHLLQDSSSYVRSSLAMAVAMRDGREAHGYLLKLLEDADSTVCKSAIMAMAVAGDSRSLFALANYYDGASYAVKSSIVSSLAESGDSRAVDFLVQMASIDFELLENILTVVDSFQPKEIFLYSFAGPEHLFVSAPEKTGQIVVTGKTTIEDSSRVLVEAQEDFSYRRPQTYVVFTEWRLCYWRTSERARSRFEGKSCSRSRRSSVRIER